MNLSTLRRHFPFFSQQQNRDLRYFDSAATTQKPKSVIDAISQFYLTQNVNVHRASYSLASSTTSLFEQTRSQVAQFLNASATDEIVFTKGATESINLVAKSLSETDWPAGGRILLSATEHHANLVPWQELAIKKGLAIDVIPLDQNGCWGLEKGLELLTEQTCIVALGWVSNALGTINPIYPLLKKARQLDCVSLVDAAQAAAHLPIDVIQLDCDFLVFSGHKMYGPTGVGVLYGKRQRLAQLPVFLTGGEMVERVSYQQSSYLPSPFKFEAGTPNIEGVVAFCKAVDFVSQNRNLIEQHEAQLLQHLRQQLTRVPELRSLGDQHQSIATVSFVIDNLENQDVGLLLSQRGFAVRVGHHCAMPLMHSLGLSGTVRVSLACYNTLDEIDDFVDALVDIVSGIKNLESLNAPPDEIVEAEYPLAMKIKSARGWDNIYRQIMLAGKQLNRLSETEKSPNNEVFGCESRVWLACRVDVNSRLQFTADSDGKIIRGLLALLLEPVQNQSAESILNFDFSAHLGALGLDSHLSESRGNGVKAVVDRITVFADQNRC